MVVLGLVCVVVFIPYVDAVVSVTVIHVLLCVLPVCMLRECEGTKVTEMLVWWVGEVTCEYMGGTRGSDVVSIDECGAWVERCMWSV